MSEYITTVPYVLINDKIDGDNMDVINRNIHHRDDIIKGAPNAEQTRYGAEFYKSIGFDIVAETVFDYPYPCITEKTIRPIAMKRFFIVVGPAHVLKMLHSKGFKTFSHIIDESYDDEDDPIKRFELVKNAIKQACSMDIDKIQELVNNNKNILEHNFQTLAELETKELDILYQTLKI